MIAAHLNFDDSCVRYEYIILMGDFNTEMSEGPNKCLVKEPTCFTNVEYPNCNTITMSTRRKI